MSFKNSILKLAYYNNISIQLSLFISYFYLNPEIKPSLIQPKLLFL